MLETPILGEPRGPATNLRMTPEQTVAAVEPGGLTLQKQVEVSPYHYGLVFQRQPGAFPALMESKPGL